MWPSWCLTAMVQFHLRACLRAHFTFSLQTEDDRFQEGHDDTVQDRGPFVEQHGLSLWQMDVEKNGAAVRDDHHCKV